MTVTSRRRCRKGAAAVAACWLLAACVPTPPALVAPPDGLAARVEAVLARRGLGADALGVIDNVIRHDAHPPPHALPIVRELLGHPLAAADTASLFDRVVPAPLRRLVEDAASRPVRAAAPVTIRELLDPYLAELAEARRLLGSAVRGDAFDAVAIVRDLDGRLPTSDRLREVAATIDRASLDRAIATFLDATAEFVRALRAAGPRLSFPETAVRFDSAVGVVSIGTRGDDVHGPGAAVIVDPGGDDTYERGPVTGGAVSVIVDLGGDDRYRGSDLVVNGLSALVDLAGRDTYAMSGPGLGAAIAGASIVLDLEGDDTYEAGVFGQGAAAFGLGALVDLRGNDTYRIGAAGQGLGLAGGLGLLWDRAGHDAYTVAGLPDVFGRGGGISLAQGAGEGARTMLGGGVGILRDDAGDDVYTAEMFAQGMGYYHGLGVLWDRGGRDRYRAVRYAQGSGVHEAIGVLRDESGDDHYELAVGVGQGMGLDLAVGLLIDDAGDDDYQAPSLAQGTATANGLGLLVDSRGTDRWRMGADRRAWGRSQWLRGLPSVGVLLYDPARARFEHDGAIVDQPPDAAAFGGPFGTAPVEHEPPSRPVCPSPPPADPAGPVPTLAEALRLIEPGFSGGAVDGVIDAHVRRRLITDLPASLAELPPDDFEVVWSLGEALRCAVASAGDETVAALWTAMDRVLVTHPASPFAGALASAMLARPVSGPALRPTLERLDRHPRCGVRAAALRLREATAEDEASRASALTAARSALRSRCWRLQATALDLLRRGGAHRADSALPSFLRARTP